MDTRRDKGGWVVGERKENRIFYLSRRFETRDEAVVERDRMSALPQYQDRELEVTFWQTEQKKKRRLNSGRRSSRR
jgi:hypothetical protein